MTRSHLTTAFALFSLLLFAGCAGKTARVAEEAPAPTVTEVDSKPAPEPVSIEDIIAESSKREAVTAAPPTAGGLEIVFFDYDSSVLTAKARRTLENHAEWLQENKEVTATIEGHCDERGSDRYNLALGERRAAAARDYLLAKGVTPDRLAVVSYGKERPAAVGHDETAWEKNRRVAFR
ncbi:MAG: peptidoglycan-associated lipoprotein Pal [Deferrisomatales bacterium]